MEITLDHNGNLSPEVMAICDEVCEEYSALPGVGTTVTADHPAVVAWIHYVYEELYKLPVPPICVVPSPRAACELATKLTGKEITSTDSCGISELGWIADAVAWNRLGQIADDDLDFCHAMLLRDFTRVAVDTILLTGDDNTPGQAIVISYPSALLRDPEYNLHNETAPAITWADGNCDWFWHNVRVPMRVIEMPESYSKEEYSKLSAEVRRALGERLGWTRLVEMLGTKEMSTCFVDGLKYTLLRCEDGSQFLQMQSPILQDGSQPNYTEPVHEDLSSAKGARLWRAGRRLDGSWMSVEECETHADKLSINQHA